MPTKVSLDDLTYRFHRRQQGKPSTKRLEVIGIDSEAYDTGQPFMFAFSDGTVVEPADVLSTMFAKRYRGKAFVCYNMKYDEGALLYSIPSEPLDRLRKYGIVSYAGYLFRSIPGKMLSVARGHKSIKLFDIAQFYAMSLDQAARRYLNDRKREVETLRFTPEYVGQHWQTIAEYCVHDASLAARLAQFFIDLLIEDYGIYPQKLYSTGYIAGVHFTRTCDTQDVDRFMRFHPNMLSLACDAYTGGKFEVYRRGFGQFWQYDINSAYPAEIRDLKSTNGARIVADTGYRADATYGILRADIIHSCDYSPVAYKRSNGLNIYPAGGMPGVALTKIEYDYLISRGAKIRIREAYWIYCRDDYPYRDEVDRLYALKRQYKGVDDMRYLLVKILLNSFYGKLVQITPKTREDDDSIEYHAGYLFNPILAGVITARVRVRMCEACEAAGDHAVAVHTDSVITTRPMPELPVSAEIGDWSEVESGPGVVIGSGVYQIGDRSHYRGFVLDTSLVDVVRANEGPLVVINQKLVLPWRLVVFRNADREYVNRFVDSAKVLSLDFDTKRRWPGPFDGSLQPSRPIVMSGVDKAINLCNYTLTQSVKGVR